jgi:transformation/transcription domain-associated protein
MDKEFHYRINALLERFIVESTLEASTSLSSSELSKSPDSSSENPFSSDDTKMGGSCLALFSLDLIETVSKISPSFAETFTGTIVGLAEKLAKRHSTISPNNVRQATLSNQGGNSKHISPTAAIINFWSTSIGTAGRKEEIESKSPLRQDGGQFLAVDRYVGTSIRSLVICLRLAGSSKLPFIFSSERQTFFHLLGSILESCNSVHIVLAAVRLVGNWLLMENGRSPLTAKEKASFLWKLSSIDCNTLPPVVSQPVADLVASYLAPKILSRSLSFNKLRIDCGDLPARLLVASLLHANENIRREILASYIASMNFIDEGVGETSKIGITFQLLWNLLHSDFEGLGRRLWTIVFTDVLLECASPRLATHTDSGWLPPPSVEWSPSAQASIESSCPEYFHFLSFVTETRKNSEGNAKRCLDATRSLAHGDELLSQSLFETLISSSWKALIDNEQRLSLVVPIEHLIARPYHAQQPPSPSCIIPTRNRRALSPG